MSAALQRAATVAVAKSTAMAPPATPVVATLTPQPSPQATSPAVRTAAVQGVNKKGFNRNHFLGRRESFVIYQDEDGDDDTPFDDNDDDDLYVPHPKSLDYAVVRKRTMLPTAFTSSILSTTTTTTATSTAFVCGLLAGVAQAGVFNPYDRALFLSVKHQRPFLSRWNWNHPYSGFCQSLGGRVISGGLYFPTEQFCLKLLRESSSQHNHNPQNFGSHYNFIAGTLAGAMNAIILNPLTAIKYQTWGNTAVTATATAVGSSSHNHHPRSSNVLFLTSTTTRPIQVSGNNIGVGMIHTAACMFRDSGGSVRPFFNGLAPTLYRDICFGGCYTFLRLQIQWYMELQPHEQWQGNFVAAALATLASGPFNYARNIQLSTPPSEHGSRHQTTITILQNLWQQVQREQTVLDKSKLLQNRLRLGWGTARVALGMAFAHAVYDALQKQIKAVQHQPPSYVHHPYQQQQQPLHDNDNLSGDNELSY